MTTDAQKKATAKYLAGKKTFTIRVDPEEAEQIQKAAEKQGKSVNAYILDAVQAWMEQEQPNDWTGYIFTFPAVIDRPGRGSTSQYFILAPKLHPNRVGGVFALAALRWSAAE